MLTEQGTCGQPSRGHAGRAVITMPESAMVELHPYRERAISNELHPLVNLAIVAFVLMVIAAVWIFFAGDAYAEWLDVVITGLFAIAMSIPAVLWVTWLRNANPASGDHRPD